MAADLNDGQETSHLCRVFSSSTTAASPNIDSSRRAADMRLRRNHVIGRGDKGRGMGDGDHTPEGMCWVVLYVQHDRSLTSSATHHRHRRHRLLVIFGYHPTTNEIASSSSSVCQLQLSWRRWAHRLRNLNRETTFVGLQIIVIFLSSLSTPIC